MAVGYSGRSAWSSALIDGWQASSEIENIVSTADKPFLHLSAEKAADPATKKALRYRHALLDGYNQHGNHLYLRHPESR